MAFPHICNILKGFQKQIYRYIYWFQPDDLTLANNLRILLGHSLVTNQHLINTFTELRRQDLGDEEFYRHYPRSGVFPKYLNEIPQRIIQEHGDSINEEIDNIQPIQIKSMGEPIPARQCQYYQNEVETLSNRELLDLRRPYKQIIGLLKSDNNLPEVKAGWFERSESAYFIGGLLNAILDEYEQKNYEWRQPDFNVFYKRIDSFVKGIEVWMIETSKIETWLKGCTLESFQRAVLFEENYKLLYSEVTDQARDLYQLNHGLDDNQMANVIKKLSN